jgi:uncharacterized protein with PIN domain
MDTQEAMKIYEGIFEVYNIASRDGVELQQVAFGPQGLEALKVGYSALSETAAREKGCYKCNDPVLQYAAVSFPKTEAGKVNVKNMEAEEAYFCPNCGRDLS